MLSDLNLAKILQYNMKDPLTVADQDGNYVMVNEVAAKNLGLSLEEMTGMNAKSLVERGIVDECPTIAALEAKKTVVQIFHAGTQDPKKPFFATAVPLFGSDNRLVGALTSTSSCDTLENFLHLLKAEKQKRELRDETISYMLSIDQHTLLYASKKMKKLVDDCTEIAKTSCTVQLTGESGSGKEVLARYIHSVSNRSNRPFIPVNCAAIPHELFESEFFGYSPGAFTGANKAGKHGLLKMANEGTLFLDEVGELPLHVQSKLLRFLESGEYFPVGSSVPQVADIRIISATNRNLKDMVSAGSFREDLFYRLNVLPLTIPPLRERKSDIPVLADYFVQIFNKKHAKNYALTQQDIDDFNAYPWPGNVRELRNTVERMVVLDRDIKEELHTSLAAHYVTKMQPLPAENLHPDLTLEEALQQFEIQYIQAVLEKCGGSVAKAASILNIHRSTLYRKLSISKE